MIGPIAHLQKKRHLIASCLIGLIVTAITIALTIQIIIQSEKDNLKRSAAFFQQDVIRVGQAREAIFEFAKTLGNAPCSPDTLSAFRRQLYLHHVINDIVAFDPNAQLIVCSALAGVLQQPYAVPGTPRRNPVFPDRLAWNEPVLGFLPGEDLHHLMRDGSFGVVLNTRSLKEAFANEDWEVYVRNGEDEFSHHAFGGDLYGDYETYRTSILPVEKVVVRVCVTDDHFLCMLLGRPILEVMRNQSLAFLPSIFLAMFLGLAGFGVTERHFARRDSVEGRVGRALRNRDAKTFFCHYQPVVDLGTGRIGGCEILARFKDEIGVLSPVDFIPVIEKTGQTWAFTELIMRTVLDDFASFGDLPPRFRLAVNVFPLDLAQDNLASLRESKELNGLMARGPQVVFEILETSMTEFGTTALAFQFLAQSGVEIAIDDFGTGFSNLEQLKAVDADYLKIDKTFVEEILGGRGTIAGSLVRHIVSLAAENGIRVVAEGVEQDEQAHALKDLGVGLGQGYLFSRPVPCEDFKILLRDMPVLWEDTRGSPADIHAAQ